MSDTHVCRSCPTKVIFISMPYRDLVVTGLKSTIVGVCHSVDGEREHVQATTFD